MVLLDIPSTIMSLGGIAIAIGATVDAEIVMIEAAHKKLEHAGPGADRHKLLAEARKEVTRRSSSRCSSSRWLSCRCSR